MLKGECWTEDRRDPMPGRLDREFRRFCGSLAESSEFRDCPVLIEAGG